MSSDINVQTFSGKVNITSNLLVGSSHLFVDTIDNRVGITTTTPHAGLHVNSNAYVNTDFRVGSDIVMNETTGRITATSFDGDGSLLQNISSDSGSWVNGTNSNVHLATSTDQVGIGTTIPSHKLTVAATSGDAEVHIQAQGNDGGDAILYFNGSPTNQRKCAIISSNVAPNSYCKQDLHFCMETTDDLSDVDITDSKMVLTNSGKVGIGNNIPDGPLHVTFPGNSNFTGITYQNTDVKTVLGNTANGSTNSSFIQVYANVTNTVPDANSSKYVLALQPFGGSMGIGTVSPSSTLHINCPSETAGRVNIQRFETLSPVTSIFTGLNAANSSNGRAQLVLSSAYSDVVIASSQVNNAHGSTVSFVTYNPSNTSDYRKFVINQGNWGTRKEFLDFGLSSGVTGDTNPHSAINSTDTVLTLDGTNKRVGINTENPHAPLDVRGAATITSGDSYSVKNGYMQAGSLNIGSTGLNYGGGSGWNSNTAGLMLECADNTEIAVHDAGLRIASLMYYVGGSNQIQIGRNMGWGNIGQVYSPAEFFTDSNKSVIRGGSPTLYLRDTNHRSGMIHMNDNRMYFLSGGTDSESWAQTANSRWPLYLQTDTNLAVFGGEIDMCNQLSMQYTATGHMSRLKNSYRWSLGGLYNYGLASGASSMSSASNQDPWSIWESDMDNEGSSIAINGDTIAMISPADQNTINYYDEDTRGRLWYIQTNGTITAQSDARLKTDISDILFGSDENEELNKYKKLRIISYKQKKPENVTRITTKYDKIYYGVIAQEVLELYPECVDVPDDGGYYSVHYNLFNLITIKVLQTEIKKRETIQTELTKTKSDLQSEKEKVRNLESRVALLETDIQTEFNKTKEDLKLSKTEHEITKLKLNTTEARLEIVEQTLTSILSKLSI